MGLERAKNDSFNNNFSFLGCLVDKRLEEKSVILRQTIQRAGKR
jgi:hypothetical protein